MTIKSAGLDIGNVADSVLPRFEARCGKPNGAECIEWIGCKGRGGYGLFYVSGYGSTTAHRAAWALKRGAIPAGMLVLHRCDNPSCVNVDHLFLGEPVKNTRDMMAKGRHGWRKGTPWQKLNAVDAERIRDLRRAGHTQQEVADWMAVSRPLISLIESRKFSYS